MLEKCQALHETMRSDEYFRNVGEVRCDNILCRFMAGVNRKVADYDESIKISCLSRGVDVSLDTNYSDLITDADEHHKHRLNKAYETLGSDIIQLDFQESTDPFDEEPEWWYSLGSSWKKSYSLEDPGEQILLEMKQHLEAAFRDVDALVSPPEGRFFRERGV